MWILFLLALASSSMAQPINGPWTIFTADSAIRDIEVCVRGHTADVIWIEGNQVLQFPISLDQIGEPQHIELSVGNYLDQPDLFDAQAFDTNFSVCLLSTTTSTETSGLDNLFLLAFDADDGPSFDHLVESSYYREWPNGGWGSTAHGYSLRANGSRFCVGFWSGSVTVFDTWYTSEFMVFDSTLTRIAWYSTIDSPWPGTNCIYYFPISEDSIQIAAETQIGSLSENFCKWNFVSQEDPACASLAENESGDPIDFRMIDQQTLLGVYMDGTVRQTYLTDSQTVARTILPATFPAEWTPATAFSPSLGFAILQASPGALLLARIDTSGNEVQSVGTLYSVDGPPFVVNADVTITEDGKVVAVWTEYENWEDGPRTIKIAWTDWNTFLGTPEQTIPIIPDEFSLSTYPNPFNSTVNISYELPNSGKLALTIFDIQGRLVETLFNDFAQAGAHVINWSPNHLSSGVYFAKLKTDRTAVTRKLLYLK
jgi:hypothetical protein